MLEAYIDESGIHDTAHACVMAGYWGGENQWRRFERRWKKIIEDANTPGLKEFHAVEFWKRSKDGKRVGLYRDWTEEKAGAFLDSLLACIGEHRIFPTITTLVVSEWKKLTKDERIFLTGGRYDRHKREWVTFGAPNRTYFLPFQFCIVQPAEASRGDVTVNYVFDLNKQFKHYAADLYKLTKNDKKVKCRTRMGELSFLVGEDAPGLQAADLLAYEAYQYSRARTSKPDQPIEMSATFQAAVRNKRNSTTFCFLNRQGLEVVLAKCPEHLR